MNMTDSMSQRVRQLADELIERGLRVCTAESCTGGLIAKSFTDLSGSSAWFERGFVTYSNQAKMDLLQVREATLRADGAVSLETALQMAAGALANSAADLAVSVTGIAGPDGGSEEKPVGTVCFGFAIGDRVDAERCHFDGDRAAVREQSALHAVEGLLARLD
ncbi:MAG TPA: CinA family protein [Gammaproteobacteria bacterium]|nr:CinA family protein [Gammaproteobacteria bacterium]